MNDVIVAQEKNTAGLWSWICLGLAWVAFLVPVPGLGIVGWGLNLAAFILAVVAMSKRGALGGLFQLLASLIVSPFVYFIGLIIFVGSMSGAPEWSEWMQQHASDQGGSHGGAAEEANQAASTTSTRNIAAIEAMADAASVAPPAAASVAPAAASTTW